MATLLRNMTPVVIPPNAERLTIDGKPHVRITRGGKKTTFQVSKDGEKYLRPSKKWYGLFKNANGKWDRKPLHADKSAAMRMLTLLDDQARADRTGMAAPAEKHAKRTITEHLDDYAAVMIAKGDTEYHVKRTKARIAAVLDGCSFVFLADADSTAVSKWLTDQRRGHTHVDVPEQKHFTPSAAATLLGVTMHRVAEVVKRHGLPAVGQGRARRLPRETVQEVGRLMAKGIGPTTQNHYVVALRGFFAWMTTEQRIGFNPFTTLEKVNQDVDVRHARREITSDELGRLFAATAASARTFRGLTGEQRHTLYLAAVTSGFRLNALAKTVVKNFDFPGQTLTLAARVNKSRKLKVQPLPAVAVELIAVYVKKNKITGLLWPGKWNDRAADMLRLDLEEAGIQPVVERRDGTPLHADFHAIRHTYISQVARTSPLQIAQSLAGHSTPVQTMKYVHVTDQELADAAQKIPVADFLNPPPTEKNAQKNAQAPRIPLHSTARICTVDGSEAA